MNLVFRLVEKEECHTFPGKSVHTEISPLRSPGFPVETRGFDDLHTALSKESRTRFRR